MDNSAINCCYRLIEILGRYIGASLTMKKKWIKSNYLLAVISKSYLYSPFHNTNYFKAALQKIWPNSNATVVKKKKRDGGNGPIRWPQTLQESFKTETKPKLTPFFHFPSNWVDPDAQTLTTQKRRGKSICAPERHEPKKKKKEKKLIWNSQNQWLDSVKQKIKNKLNHSKTLKEPLYSTFPASVFLNHPDETITPDNQEKLWTAAVLQGPT